MNFKNELEKYYFLNDAVITADELNVNAFIIGGFVRDLILKEKKMK